MKTDRRENVKFVVTNYKDSLHHKLPVIPKVFIATLSMCLFAEKDVA